MEIAKYPLASHSNSRVLCNHPRNLTDEMAKEMFQKGGVVHVVYNPPFTTGEASSTIPDLIKHIDHFCGLGGVKQLGLGSDFDGIANLIVDLEDASKTQNLINELLKHYSEEEVKGFAYQNFLNYVPR
jgi:membrane dipeptidase